MKVPRIPKMKRLTYQFFTEIWDQSQKGFYVEIGAWDGKKKNSTIILEQAGWDGVCIEASPASYKTLIENRKCRCLNVAVFDKDGEVDFAIFPGRPEWNGIITTFNTSHKKLLMNNAEEPNSYIQKILCKPWSSLDLPVHIDYLQIDTEGSEIQILKCVDWTTTTISYICLEDNNAAEGDTTYRDFMISLGYKCIREYNVDYLWKKI